MSYKKVLGVAAACAVAITSTQVSLAKGKKVSYNKSAFSNYKNMPANDAAASANAQLVNNAFPGWIVATDKVDGMPVDMYGAPLPAYSSNNIDNAQYYIEQKLAALGILKNEWKQVSNISAPKANYVYYTREIDGHAVVFSRLSFRFTKTGGLNRIEMSSYGTPTNIAPVLSVAGAKDAAIKDLDAYTGITLTNTEINSNWAWFPVPGAKGYELRPAYNFTITGKAQDGIPLKLTGYIDAVNGTVLYRTNEVKETGYDLTVKGMVYKSGITLPATLEPLPDLDLNIGVATYTTDTGGNYNNLALLLPLSTGIPLAGKWSTVYDSITATIPSFTNLVTLPGTIYTYPVTAPSSSRHVNAYYHVNRVHNFMKGYFPTFTGMDISLPTNVDLTSGTCNAYYSGSDINFYAAGGGCVSFAEMGDVIYHEYGHGVSDKFYHMITSGTINNGALNEACSDIWALSITHSPILAKNAFTPYGGFIRRYDVIPQVYPIDLEGSDVHKDGQIIAGSWWDVGVNIGVIDTMTKLFTDVYYDVPDGPDGTEGKIYQSILISALMADDNDGNLTNGTPHYNQIVAAFAKHGVYMDGDAILKHTELTNQPAATPIAVSAKLHVTTKAYLHDMTMYYRINNAGAWTPVILDSSSLTHDSVLYSGNIPAQSAGAIVEYYFIVHDGQGQPNAFFPISCNPALPANQMSLPYQFGVDMSVIDSMNFDVATTGWSIGSNPGDDATDGLWSQVTPHGLFGIWPVHDHTSGLGKCLESGTEVLSNPNNSSTVTEGTSTVISPVFDISNFSAPVIEYYRFFSNEQSLDNFKDDPWIVKIRDANSSTWQTVEDTYQADDMWRRKIFQVSTYLPAGTTSIQVKFFSSDSVNNTVADAGQSYTIGAIDDFYLYDKGGATGVATIAPVKASIFPDPADNSVQIVLAAATNGKIGLYNMAGQLVSEVVINTTTNSYTINTNNIPAGQYNLVIQTGKSIESKKMVIIHK